MCLSKDIQPTASLRDFPTPYYVIYEDRLRHNLELIKDVSRRAGVQFIMAFKANAVWRTFEIIKEYFSGSTASSLNELRLGREYLGDNVHSYCPAYTPSTIDKYVAGSTHITFNSLSQWHRFKSKVEEHNKQGLRHVSPGLRVNPRCSVIETDIYNPALPGSRFGVGSEQLSELPEGIEGLHFHALCESDSYDLEKVLKAFEEQFGHLLPQLKWVNMGGGNLLTRQGYNLEHLIKLLSDFKSRYPWLEVILEPGSAFTWQTGDLVASVVDVVENDGIRTGILDVSFACHMPDTLEMPYQPVIAESVEAGDDTIAYRMGGNSCLSGDYMGDWYFKQPLAIGDRLTFKDMNHYTTVKTNMFNGIDHPAIVLAVSDSPDSPARYLRQFDYNDYKNRMS